MPWPKLREGRNSKDMLSPYISPLPVAMFQSFCFYASLQSVATVYCNGGNCRDISLSYDKKKNCVVLVFVLYISSKLCWEVYTSIIALCCVTVFGLCSVCTTSTGRMILSSQMKWKWNLIKEVLYLRLFLKSSLYFRITRSTIPRFNRLNCMRFFVRSSSWLAGYGYG